MTDGDKALAKLDEAKTLLKQRDAIFRTGEGIESNQPVAQQTAKRAIRHGNAIQFVNDPAGMKTLYAQVDDATREGMKGQISKSLLGRSHRDFAKNWSQLDPEVKAMNFTPDQIAKADMLAQRGPAALDDIANRALLENSRIIQDATNKLKSIGQQRMKLGDTSVQIRKLNSQIKLEQDAIKRAKLQKTLELQTKASSLRSAINEEQATARQNFAIQMRQAQDKIKQIQELKRKLKIGATVIGLGAAAEWGRKTNVIGSLLGFPEF
jgi:hypothetical protein